MFQPEKFSDYIATVALLFSCASLYLSWRNFDRDASRLKIRLDFEIQPGLGSMYIVRFTNAGRRPSTVIKVHARLKNGKRYPVFDAPTRLEETQFKELTVPVAKFGALPHPLHITVFEVEDSAGKIYQAYTWKLWRHIRKVWKPGIDGFQSDRSS